MKRILIIFCCLKLLIDPLIHLQAKAQTTSDLTKLQSQPVSFKINNLPNTVSLSSLLVSYTLSDLAETVQLSSPPVSFNTINPLSNLSVASLPASYSLLKSADSIKLSSSPVSYFLNSFTGSQIKLASSNVSYRTYNGIPILESISPNVLPITTDGSTFSLSLMGDNFVKDSVASIETSTITTKYISSKELTVTIPSNYVKTTNSFYIYVANPPPEGGVSDGANIKVVDPTPVVKISATPSIGVAPQIVTFDASGTDDILAKYFRQTLSYSWDFGDEFSSLDNLNSSTNVTTTHKYLKPGKYLVSLNALNSYNKSSGATQEIEIREKNFAPEGTFETNITTGDVPLLVYFTSKASDKENDKINYLWDFGDGNTSKETNPTHIYTIPGIYKPLLTVTDSLGAKTNITSAKLTLLPPNNKPISQIAGIPKDSTLKVNKDGIFTSIVQFSSNGTFDPDGEDLTYSWDFGDNSKSSELNPKYEYVNSGEYVVKLTVTDPRKGQDTKEIKVSVSKPLPSAIATIDKTTGNSPFEVRFDGSSSQDFDAKPVTLKWDFGDGLSETVDSSNGIVKHNYENPGVYLVTLTATTNDNRSKKITTGNIIVGPNKGIVGQIKKLEGDEKGVLGKVKIKLSASGSFDPEGGTQLKYKWSWSARTWDVTGNLIDISKDVNNELEKQGINTQEIFDYTFTNSGQFTPVLEIEKSDGTKSQFIGETYTITPEQAPVSVAKIRSENITGEPGLEVNFDGSESYDPKAGGRIKLFTWDFGDNEKSNEISPKHIFSKEGTFTPTLIVIDNDNQIGFSQSSSIKISKSPNINNSTLLSRTALANTRHCEEQSDPLRLVGDEASKAIPDLSSQDNNRDCFAPIGARNDTKRNILFQTKEETQEPTDSMLKEAISSYISTDNTKPEIGPINIYPKTVKPGSAVKLSAFVRDDIALSSFGYSVTGADNKIIIQKAIDLINQSDDKVLKNEFYIEETIPIPKDLPFGIYKIKLTASDTSNNQVAKINLQDNKEEISATFEVSSNDHSGSKIISNFDNVIEPNEVKEIEDNSTITKARTIESATNEIVSKYRLHLKGKNITDNHNEKLRLLNKESNNKLQTSSFQVTGISGVSNPYYPSSGTSSINSLSLTVIPGTERDGYIAVGTNGSLQSTYFNNWFKTNIYVDGSFIGTINWNQAAGISYTSNQASTTKYIQFRPVNNSGIELSSATWTGNYFTFTKILSPTVTSISPREQTAGRGSFDLYVYGDNFTQSSKIYFDGNQITPYASGVNLLISRIPANFLNNPGQKYVYVQNSDGSKSYASYFIVNANTNDPCSLNKSLPQTYWGADSRTILNGNNVYLTSPTATIEGTGSVIIPFCLDKNYDVKTSLTVTNYKNSSASSNIITVWLDGNYIGGKISYGSEGLSFNNLNTSSLAQGTPHRLEISYSASSADKLIIQDTTFSNGGGPRLDSINPTSVSLEGLNRTLAIYGDNFDQNTIVYLNDKPVNKINFSNSQITISLPDKFDSPGSKSIYLIGNNKRSSTTSLTVRDKIELVPSSFKVSPIQPFPGNSFSVELTATDKVTLNNNPYYAALIGVIDPDGKLLTIPNISNSFSTIILSGIKDSTGQILFTGSIPLSINTKPGNYTIITSVIRLSDFGYDYSDLEAYKFFTDKLLGYSNSGELVPASHRLTFTPKPAVLTLFGIEETNSENTGFIQSVNKVIQDDQSIKFKVQIPSGQENISKLRFNFKAGDGKETGLISTDSAIFTYHNQVSNTTVPLTFSPSLDVFWIEDGIQTKIGNYNGPTIQVYPNYKPVAKARVFSEQYPIFATNPPLRTAFIDVGSYDPNQRFSSTIDYVNSQNNIWELYQKKFNQSENLLSPPIDSKISDDKKTFLSGSLVNPGTYFGRLTVRDQTGQTDTASTESVTVTYPHQMVIVFATTDPNDKKVYDPNTVDSSNPGVPVQFMSNVTILGGNPTSTVYKWDFGDGSCSTQSLPSDCTQANPKHYYFDGKKSFNGQPFIDRKSITPKLTASTMFASGISEIWEASAGTITFNAEPNFILLDIKSDETSGIVPFTVNLMIDPQTAKQVNATVTKYEIDYSDGSIESGNITYNDLINKTFTHTYTKPDTYSPKLKVSIKESEKVFVFNVANIIASGTGQAGIYLLDDLSKLAYTNEPIVTFMVLSAFSNPNDINNSLRIRIKDENGNENITELDPGNSSQTISLSEGKNTYYFETSDSSSQVLMSEVREIVLDSIEPSLNIFTPQDEDILKNENIKLFGSTSDENFDHIEYQIDNNAPIRILEDDFETTEDGNIIFFKEISSILNGKHKLTIRASDKAGNTTEEVFNIGVGNNTYIFNRIFSLRDNSEIPIIGNTEGEEGYSIGIGSPFKIQTSVKFYGDTAGKNDAYADLILMATGSYKGSNLQSLDKELFEDNKELTALHNTFNAGDLDGASPNTNIIYRSSQLNQNDFISPLYNPSTNKYLSKPWNIGTHNIKIMIGVTSPSGGVSLVNLDDPNDISTQREQNYNIKIIRPVEVSKSLEPNVALLNENTAFTSTVKVKDFLTFNLQDKKIKLLLDQSTLIKPVGSQSKIENLMIVDSSESIDPNNNKIGLIKVSFDFKADKLPSSGEEYKLTIPVELTQDSENPNGYKTKVEINIPVQGQFPAEIINPSSGEIVTYQNIISAKLLGAASNINQFEKQNVKFALSINGKGKIQIKANNGDEPIIRVTGNSKTNDDINFQTKLPFDLHTLASFKDLFTNGEAFGLIEVYSTYTNIKNNLTFSGKPQKLILIDNPQVTKQTKLKKLKSGNKELNLVVRSNTSLNKGDELIVMLTPFDANNNEIKSLDETIKTQKFSFTNSTGAAKLTESKIIILLPETDKVKIEIQRSDIFLNRIKEELPNEWKENFIQRVREEEKQFRVYTISVNDLLKAQCDAINTLLNEKLTNAQEISALSGLAKCQLQDKQFFTESSKETDSIKLPFANSGTALIPNDPGFNIQSVSFPFKDQITLSELKQLLKDLKLLSDDNNNGYDLETEEAIYELLNIIDKFRCNLADSGESSSNLKQQIVQSTFQCGISTSNFQEYILSSIKQDLPLVVSLIELSKTLKEIGIQSPIANIDLPDSLLLRAIAIPTLPSRLLPWQIQAIGAAGLIIYNALANSKLKVETQDTTCKKTFGIIDRRFIIGKDLNNLDIKRTNTMVGISVEGYTFNPKVIEPFAHIPAQPGLYYACLPEGTYNFQLQFNGQNTFSMSVTIPSNSELNFIEPFVGGVFRKYGKTTAIEKIIQSKRILDIGEGDIKTIINPTGTGAYITTLSLAPNIESRSHGFN
ncbi:MAG: PKD domain-containing protein [Candidatus Melainabacteria bacterium]|nr:PKD domain-containing protein [Candidatus Melainabacteria bacterium]